MTFTPTPPTKPGAYWFKKANNSVILVNVERLGPALNSTLRAAGIEHYDFGLKFKGLWSTRLVPVDEVENTFREGWRAHRHYGGLKDESLAYYDSRAKQVVEGEV